MNSQVNDDDENHLSGQLASPLNPNAPIQIVQLSKHFGAFKAVDDLSLGINADEVFCLLGHNGAGKTTAI